MPFIKHLQKQKLSSVVLLAALFLMTEGPAFSDGWQQLIPGGGNPSVRRGVQGLYDPANERLVFQGGETPSIQFLQDTWYFDLNQNNWVEPAIIDPASRCHHTLIVDASRGRGLLFGGFPRTNELWSFDLAAEVWSNITPTQLNPAPRCLHTAVNCKIRNEMIVYGGLNGVGTPDLSDTWSYDLENDGWSLVLSDSAPGKRYGHAAGLDEAHDRMIIFGGFFLPPQGSSLNVGDLWAFDLETRTWTQLEPTTPGPSSRQFARGATVPDGSGMILFGGLTDQGYSNELWFLNYTDLSWTLLEPPGGPPLPRDRHTLILDEDGGNRLWIAFGESTGGQQFSDVWVLDLTDVLPDGNAPPDILSSDINLDGTVDSQDLFLIKQNWHQP